MAMANQAEQAKAASAQAVAQAEVQKQQALTASNVQYEQAKNQMQIQRMEQESLIRQREMQIQHEFDLQLKKMEEWHKKRHQNAKALIKVLHDYEGILRTPVCEGHLEHAYYKLYTYLKSSQLKKGWSRQRIISEFHKRNVPCFEGSCSEIYKEKAFEGTNYIPTNDLDNAKELGESSIMFLVHPTLTNDNISYIQSTIKEVFDNAL